MKKSKFILLGLLLVVTSGFVSAQGLKVTGVVTEAATNEPVPFATVSLKGATVGVSTDINGYYEIDATADGVLIFSFIGLKTTEVPIEGRAVVSCLMESDAETLDEVVVTGYGTYTKKEFTGSASVLRTDKVKDMPTVSAVNRLTGTTPGVQITSSSGQPGSTETIRIRGMGSINAGNEPLFVIDGVPVSNGSISSVGSAAVGTSILSTISPSDIESMTVIKDAAAASLYGSRAANGVIVITTKRGAQGATKFNFKMDMGFSNMAVDYRPTLSGDERAKVLLMGLHNVGLSDAQITAGGYDYFITKPWSGWTDWKDLFLRTGKTQNYEMSISGGSEKTRIFASLSYSDQEGITRGSSYERVTGRVNASHKFGPFSIDVSSMITSISQRIDLEGGTVSPFASMAFYISPADYPYNQDGSFNTSTGFSMLYGAQNNPLLAAAHNYTKNSPFRTFNTLTASLNLFDGFTVKQVVSYDFMNSEGRNWTDPRTGPGMNSNGTYYRTSANYKKLISQTQAMYDKTFANRHNLSVLFSFEAEDYQSELVTATGTNYANYLFPEIANAGTKVGSSSTSEYGLISYVSRLNYNYDHRYYLSASYRRDGSSRLGVNSRWGDFWSVSGSWRLSEESFWQNSIGKLFTDARVRASYGENGTLPSSLFGHLGLFNFGYNYLDIPGYAEGSIAYPDLSWERNLAFNIGFDFTIYNRFNFIVEYYNRDTKDLLMSRAISQITGFGSMLQNVGAMNNKGVELSFDTYIIRNNDFDWTVSANAYHNVNKLVSLVDGQTEMMSYPFIRKVGLPYNTFHALERAGIDPNTGQQLYYKNTPIKDANGNITGYDRSTTASTGAAAKVPVGQLEPKWSGGITNSFSYRGIDLSFTLSFAFGGHVYDHYGPYQGDGAYYAYTGGLGTYNDINKMWQKPGDNAELPRFVYNNSFSFSDRWLLPTDHLRLKNITLAYSLPQKWVKKVKLSSARFYSSAVNLFTIKSKKLYVDPESSPGGGLLTGETPSLRTITFGVELGF